MYDNHAVEQHRAAARTRATENDYDDPLSLGKENEYDDPHSLGKVPLVKATPPGVYDNPEEIVGAAKRVYVNHEGATGRRDCGTQLYDNSANLYDDGSSSRSSVPTVVYGNQAAFLLATPPSDTYESPHMAEGEGSVKWKTRHSPKFDDTIYAVRSGEGSAVSNGNNPLDHMGKLVYCQHVLSAQSDQPLPPPSQIP